MGKLFGDGGSQSQTTESGPWGPAQEALKNILGNAQELFDKNGGINGNWIDKEIADLTPEMQQAIKDLTNTQGFKDMATGVGNAMQQGNQTLGQATGGLGGLAQQGVTSEDLNKMASDLYDSEMVQSQKGQLTQDVQAGLDKNIQGLNQQASAGGNMGSSRAGVAEGVAVGEAGKAIATGSANIENSARQQAYGQALGTLQGNQNTALGALGQMGQLGLGGINANSSAMGQMGSLWNQGLQNQLMGAGIGQQNQQDILNNKWFNQTGQANAGWDNLSKYLGIAGSIGGMGGNQTTSGSGTSSGSNNMIGMGAILGGLGSLGFSDISMKKKIKKKKDGSYEWEWNKSAEKVAGKKGKDKGVLAQDTLKDNPEAVAKDKKTGRLMVDYDKA
ncbi:MAG: hypothetical protein ACRC6V_17835 [Bacteroidales bacterium]